MSIKRDVCGRLLKNHLGPDAIVVGGLGTAGRMWRAQQAGNPTYYVSDPMGIGVTLALGLALARPRRDVLYIGGDGDIVMNLGSLLTVVGSNVCNLKIVVFDNRRYETGGGASLAGADRYSLEAIAQAAGFVYAAAVVDPDEAEDRVKEFFAQNG